MKKRTTSSLEKHARKLEIVLSEEANKFEQTRVISSYERMQMEKAEAILSKVKLPK